tara:strand:+ start:298 stop:1650 length:1353 start_codon:yes stop_codon:yes gene_type:complete
MTEHYLLILFIISTFSLLLSGYPVGFVLAGTSLLFSFIASIMGVFDVSFLMAFPNRLFGIMTNQNLLAVPLFILMGMILEKTKIAENLLTAMNQIYNNTSGGYAISVVLVGALMGASTGIVGASVVTLGLLSLPVMIKNNYPKHLTCGVICASGTLGQIIPPSLVLILLADVLSSAYQQAQLNMGIFSPETVTIAELFAGAVIPGVLLPILYILYIKSFHKDLKITSNVKNRLSLVKSFLPPILLIFLVLGSIVLGIATPSEAASLGVFGAVFISSIQKQLNFNIINNCSKETIKLTSMIFMILIGATLFSLVFRGLNGEEVIQSILLDDSVDKFFTLLIILSLMFLLGFILDFIEIIFIIIPIFGPILFTLGFDPIWIGILIGMILQTSFLTPPFGFSIFYLRGVAPNNIDTIEIYKGVLPFVFIQLLVVFLIILIPGLATLLPSIILN